MRLQLAVILALWAEAWSGLCAEPAIVFENATAPAGLAMKPRSSHPDARIATGQRNFEDVYAAGYFWNIRDVILTDVNGDSSLDLFLLNQPHGAWSRLWLGNGKGAFREFDSGILPNRHISLRPAWRLLPFDFRGNGARDLLVTSGVSFSHLGRHLAGARISCITPGESDPGRLRLYGFYSSTAGLTHLLADFDGDGVVDVAAGVDFGDRGGEPGQSGTLFSGTLAGGEWELDRTEILLPIGAQCVAADFDNDGKTDILSRGYWMRPRLLRNRGLRVFEDATPGSGVEAMPGGGPVAVADFDNDGRLDIYCTGAAAAGAPGGPRLYVNSGGWKFADRTEGSGLVPPGKKEFPERFGAASAADFDNDGRTDLLVCDGKENRLYRNLGEGRFEDVVKTSGVTAEAMDQSSNAAGDVDADGRVDVVTVTASRGIAFFRNATPDRRGWLNVRPRGGKGNPDAAGTQVWVYRSGALGKPEALLGFQENLFGTDFRTAHPLHFGLGDAAECDVRVRFPSGQLREVKGAKARTTVEVLEQGGERKDD